MYQTLVVTMVGWDLTALTVRHFLDVKMENVWLIQILAFVKMAGKKNIGNFELQKLLYGFRGN